jgi:hypothetical protein
MDISHAPATGLGTALPPSPHDDVTAPDASTGDSAQGGPAHVPPASASDVSAHGLNASSLAMLTQWAAPHLGTHALAGAPSATLQQPGVAEFHAPVPNGGGAPNAPAQGPGFGAALQRLLQEPGVQALRNAALQDRLLAICSKDRAFADGLANLLASKNYTALSPSDRAAVLRDMIQLHGTRSYREAEGGNRAQAMVEILGDVSAQSAAHPGGTAIRHTLDHVLQGRVTLKLYYADVGPHHVFDFGWSKPGSGIISMNIDPRTRRVAERDNEYVDTLVHEANHFLNGRTSNGTPERFLDEFRAMVVGMEAAQGHPVSPEQQKEIIDELVDGSNLGYKELHDLYTGDDEFKAVVDGMYATLAGGPDGKGHDIPGMRVSPEDARQRLQKLDPDSDYLSKPSNVDNH